jgi:Raf kinase inhibitor-like YbhB/YbcL family protein
VTRVAALAVAVVLLVAACGKSDKTTPSADVSTISVTSTAFNPDSPLPVQFSCDGDGVSPPLAWSGVPKNATSLTLTVTDPDAHGFVHWQVKGLPPHDGTVNQDEAPPGGNIAQPWRPACPPKGAGPHHYVFRIDAAPRGSGAVTATFER